MRKNTIIVLIIVGLVGIGGWFLIKQENLITEEISNEIEGLDRKKGELEEANKTLEKQKDFKKENAAKDVIEKLKQILPKDPDIQDVLAQLYAIDKEKSAKIREINLEPREENKKIRMREAGDDEGEKKEYDFPDLIFSVKFVGKYSNIKAAIEKIEKNSRIMDIIDITIAIDGEDNDNEDSLNPMLSADIKIRTYYKP